MTKGGAPDVCRYLPVSQRDRRWGLFAYGGGRTFSGPGVVNVSHPSPFDYELTRGRIFASEYAAVFVTEGVTEFESETTGKVLLTAGDCAILVPGLWHRYNHYENESTSHLWLAFGGSHADFLLRRRVLSRRRVIHHPGLTDRLLQPYRRALAMLQSSPIGIQQALAGSVLEILGAMTSPVEQDASERGLAEVVRRAISIMEERAASALFDVRALSQEIGVDYDRFRHAFRQQTGLSPYQYHLDLRIKRAQELLLDPKLAMKQVAAELGFHDQFQFSKTFKNQTGVSPSQWRKNAGV